MKKAPVRTVSDKTNVKPLASEKPLVHELEPMKETKVTVNIPLLFIAVAIVAAGGFTGYVLARTGTSGSTSVKTDTSSGTLTKVVGLSLDKAGQDNAEGLLLEGGVDGEGTHHLERPGGETKNVYLTSSIVPLGDYVNKKVKVTGTTYDAEVAGWLMEVDRLELLE